MIGGCCPNVKIILSNEWLLLVIFITKNNPAETPWDVKEREMNSGISRHNARPGYFFLTTLEEIQR